MSETEVYCRVCRGEGTDSHPLFHPCKCRGSIKYIHQDCLMEWLKHSNKSVEKCDICNTPYKFRTIYDPEMPNNIPVRYVWAKFKSIVKTSIVKLLSISLYILCLMIQVPLFWKFMGRIYTWTVNGKLPEAHPTFFSALLYGELDLLHDQSTNFILSLLFKTKELFKYTYFSGVRYIVVFAIVHLALFIEHEWVIRDEGYIKLLQKQIGKEPRTKLIDVLRQEIRGLRNEGAAGDEDAAASLQRLEMIARAINDLQEQPNMGAQEERLRRAIDRSNDFNEGEEQRNDDSNSRQASIEIEQNEGQGSEDRYSIGIENENDSNSNNEGNHRVIQNEEIEDGNSVNDPWERAPSDVENEPIDDEEPEEAPAHNMNNLNIGNEEEQENAGGAADILEFLGISLDLTTPLFLMLICDLVIIVYLFLAYLMPHLIGNFSITLMGYLLRCVYSIVLKRFSSPEILRRFFDNVQSHVFSYSNNVWLDFGSYVIVDSTVKPLLKSYQKLFMNKSLELLTLSERIFLLTLGHAIICFAVYRLMESLVSGGKPVLGTARKVYKMLFEVACTAKVFFIFSIEIFFFPVYCGWLLDFCMAPFLLDKIQETMPDGSIKFNVLFTSLFEPFQVPYIKTILYWGLGTHYMLFFALFIGMIRGKILRSGVLFFIRSPDDPNARLIHDALSKPLSLQLSRIYLSAKVYTALVLVGIGGATWGIRYLIIAGKDSNVVLPFQKPSLFSEVIACACALDLILNKNLITKYCRWYWTRAFEISSHKLRLSHFILGRPIAEERGSIVYKDFLHRILSIGDPDFSRPVTYSQARNIFKNDMLVNACFIPDGNYVRAPDNDTVSRAFIKKLFVPVTKDDKLLSTSQPEEDATFHDSDAESLDNIVDNEDVYTVVYRPPNFKLRCFGLIILLWMFSIILILSSIFIALFLGRPIVRVLHVLSTKAAFTRGRLMLFGDVLEINWKLADIASIGIGLKLELEFLKSYDRHKLKMSRGNSENEANEEVAEERRNNPLALFPFFNNVEARMDNFLFLKLFLNFQCSFCRILWIITLHQNAVNLPLLLFKNRRLFESNDQISPGVLFVHLAVSLWTCVPHMILNIRYVMRIRAPVANISQVIFESGMLQFWQDFFITHVPYLLYSIHKNSLEFPTTKSDALVCTASLGAFILIKSTLGILSLVKKINEQVRNERYVKGREIENMDLQD